MRTLQRNKTKLFFALFTSRTEITDEYGNPSGSYTLTYADPVEMTANISAARGTADVDQFGINAQYDKTIITDDMACPIDESSVLWVDNAPTLKPDGSTDTPHDYVVKRVAKSLNSIAIAVAKVDVS